MIGSIGLPSLEVFSLIVLNFAFSDRERNFHLPILPIKRKGNQRIAFDRRKTKQFTNLGFVQQQFARRFGLMVLDVAVRVFVYVRVVKKNLLVFNARKRITNLPFAGAQSLDLCAVQDNAGLKGFEDVILVPGFGIGQDVSHEFLQMAVSRRGRPLLP